MKALVFEDALKFAEVSKPVRRAGESLIKVTASGICNTDHEIIKGYMPGFRGILGHEFIGTVVESDSPQLKDKRVTGEINLACGSCEYCVTGLERHCRHRTVVGIQNRPGAFAEFMCLPHQNLIQIPPSIPNDEAIFIEPLAASLEILDQISIHSGHKTLLFGDGKLGQLIARVVQTTGCKLFVVGKHEKKLALIKSLGISGCLINDFQPGPWDVVIEATGNPDVFETALRCVKPRGTLVMKSTFAGSIQWNPSQVVVNEIALIGSRCGRFSQAIEFLLKEKPDFSPLIEASLPLQLGKEAFQLSAKPNSLKILLKME